MKIKPFSRFLIFVLSAFILFNGVGFYALAYAKTGLKRARLRQESGHEDLQNLVLNADEFSSIKWIGKRDFIYKDHVYDVEKISASAGKITIACFPDKEETQIKNAITESFNKNESTSGNTKTVKQTLKIFPVFPFGQHKANLAFESSGLNLLRTYRQISFRSPEREIATPPPDKA